MEKFFNNKQEAKEYEAKIWFISEIYNLGFDKDISEAIYNEIKYIQEIIERYNDKIKEMK